MKGSKERKQKGRKKREEDVDKEDERKNKPRRKKNGMIRGIRRREQMKKQKK